MTTADGPVTDGAGNPTPADVRHAARGWHAAGYAVIPAKADGSKAPALPSWKGYSRDRKLPSDAEHEQWFGGGQPRGLGLICGAVSGGLEMFEIEGRAIADGAREELLPALDAAGILDLWRRLVGGFAEFSPSGGLHLLYRITDHEVPGNTKIAQRPARDDELIDEERALLAKHPTKVIVRCLAETRGEGGFVVVAPSHGTTHDTRRPWVLAKGAQYGQVPAVTWEERNALHAVARMVLDKMPEPPPRQPPATSTASEQSARGDRPGDLWAAQTPWADILQPHGWKWIYHRGDMDFWRRPGKRIGVSARTGGQFNGLYVWTSSTEFPQHESITKFRTYAILEHRGDDHAAGVELRRRGFGRPAADRRQERQTAGPRTTGPAGRSGEHGAESNGNGESNDVPTVECPYPKGSPAAVTWWRREWKAAVNRGDVEPRAEDAAPTALPAFPLHALPNPMRFAVQTTALNKRVPLDLPALLSISCVAVIAGPRLTISRGKDWFEPLIEWTLTIAESGEGKSPALTVFQDILRDVQKWIVERHRGEIERQALAIQAAIDDLTRPRKDLSEERQKELAAEVKALNKQLESLGELSPPQMQIGGSTTLEAVERAMANNQGHIAIIDDEGGSFGIVSGIYNNGVPTGLDTILKGYGGAYVPANERITRAVESIPRAVLTYGITAQTLTLMDSFRSRSLRDRGFHARWCYAIPEPVVGTRPVDPPELDHDAIEAFTRILKGIAGLPVIDADTPRRTWPTLRLTSEARKLHLELQATMEPRKHPDIGDLTFMGDWANKFEGRVLRYAGLLHLADGRSVDALVSEDTMRAAIMIGEWALAHAAEVYRRAPKVTTNRRKDDTPDTSIGEMKIRRWISKTKSVAFTTRDIYNVVRKQSWCSAADDVQAALHALHADGLVRPVPRRGADGRELPGAPWWVAHPDLAYGR